MQLLCLLTVFLFIVVMRGIFGVCRCLWFGITGDNEEYEDDPLQYLHDKAEEDYDDYERDTYY